MKQFVFILIAFISLQLASYANEFPYIQPLSVETSNNAAQESIIDQDNDGIPDNLDTCPNTPLHAKVDKKGCILLLDDDNDGVSNRNDKCQNTKANTIVNKDGCEPDSDADGVLDVKDECPNTSNEFIVDTAGCPQTAVLKITFASASATILSESFSQIEEFAKFLQNNIAYQAIIYGHTDNKGNKADNIQLSRDRATSVMNALIKHGIKLTRLTAIGMGSKKPIADNQTSQGRAQNRRIEVELLQ